MLKASDIKRDIKRISVEGDVIGVSTV